MSIRPPKKKLTKTEVVTDVTSVVSGVHSVIRLGGFFLSLVTSLLKK